MSISNYNELVASVSDWLASDELVSKIPDLITLCEASLNRQLRTRDQVKRSTASVSTQYITHPSDLAELLNVVLDTNPIKRLEQVTPSQADDKRQLHSSAGKPLYFSMVGESIELIPTPDTAYTVEIIYYAKLDALTAAATTNWCLTKHPDTYLYGVLTQAEPYLGRDERIGVWGALLSKSLEEIRTADDRAEASTGPLIMRTSNNLEYGNW